MSRIQLWNLIAMVIQALSIVILIDALLTWIPQIDRRNPLVAMLRRITQPIYRPIRQLIPPEKTGYIDLSPVIALIGLQIIGMILQRIIFG